MKTFATLCLTAAVLSACATDPQRQPVLLENTPLPSISYETAVASSWPLPQGKDIIEKLKSSAIIETDEITVHVPNKRNFSDTFKWIEAVDAHLESLHAQPEPTGQLHEAIAREYAWAQRTYNDGFVDKNFHFLCFWHIKPYTYKTIECIHWPAP